MIKTIIRYFLPSLRYILKHKVFVVLNLLGLSIGFAASLLLIQYAVYEFSFDKFHKNSKQIYRIRYDNFRNGEAEFESAAAVPAVGKAMKDNFPEVTECAWAYPVSNGYFRVGDKSFHQHKFQIVTPGFLKIFSWDFIHGDTSALSQPHSLVITESCAMEYFGTRDAEGEIIEYEDGTNYTVRGIIRDVPENSHLKFTLLASPNGLFNRFDNTNNEKWTWYDFNTYVLLKEDADPEHLEAKFDSWLSNEMSDFWEKDKRRQFFRLQSIERIHLYSKLSQESEPDESGSGRLVIVMALVGISILIIAWINYINLSSSMAWDRAREIGLRKVVGAERKHIITLFVGEALLMNILAAGLSLVLIELFLPTFSNLIGRELSLSLLKDPVFWIVLVILLAIGAFISGIYPAINLSGKRPIDIINGRPKEYRTGMNLTKILVIAQLTVSIGFITSAFFSYSQLKFIRSIPSGIDVDQTIVICGPGNEYDQGYEAAERKFKNRVIKYQDVKSVTASNNVPGIEIYLSENLHRSGDETGMINYNLAIDEDFIPSYGLELLAGRNFHPIEDSSRQSVILNLSAAELLGFNSPAEAIGKKVIFMGNEHSLVGVIKDYHQLSTKQAPPPLVHYYNPAVNTYLSLHLKSEDINETILEVEEAWREHFEGAPFEFFFLDEVCEMHYRMEKQINMVLGIFSALAIFIAAIGLFGLSIYSTLQRSKEIGIRKVNGATGRSILVMLFREYIELILIAFIIATPLTWLAIKTWLNTYEVHIKIHVHIFLLGGIIVTLAAMVFVLFHTFRVANMDPTLSLRKN